MRTPLALVVRKVLDEEDPRGICVHRLVCTLLPVLLGTCANDFDSFTNLVGAILEARLFDTHRVRGTSAVHHETKHIAVPATTGATHDNAVV